MCIEKFVDVVKLIKAANEMFSKVSSVYVVLGSGNIKRNWPLWFGLLLKKREKYN